MRHLSDGTLRRLVDEPRALGGDGRRHLDACAACRQRFAAIAADAQEAAQLFAMPMPVARVDQATALAEVRRRIAAQGQTRPAAWYRRPLERIGIMNGSATGRLVKPAGGLAIAAALVGALALTPVGSLAQSLLTVFQPQQVAPVAVTTADIQDLRNLPNLDAYGTVSGLAHPTLGMAPSAAAAGAALGVPVETPRTLPSGVPSSATYLTMAQSTASFTFSADRARAAAARDGKALPAMPAHVDGSTLQATIGPAVVAIYGGNVGAAGNGAARTSGDNGPLDNLPTLAIVQARVPVVTSTGASVNEIENYLLEQPGISPSLAAAIRRIGDPKTTLPIPVPVNLTSAQSTPVQGVTGLIIGDNTGIGSVVIWQKGGIIRAVAGALPQDQVLAIANGMH